MGNSANQRTGFRLTKPLYLEKLKSVFKSELPRATPPRIALRTDGEVVMKKPSVSERKRRPKDADLDLDEQTRIFNAA